MLTHTKLCPAGSSERSSSSEKLVVGGSMMCMTSALEESLDLAASISNRNKDSPYRLSGSCHDNVLPVNVTICISLGANRKTNSIKTIQCTGAHIESSILCILIMRSWKD